MQPGFGKTLALLISPKPLIISVKIFLLYQNQIAIAYSLLFK